MKRVLKRENILESVNLIVFLMVFHIQEFCRILSKELDFRSNARNLHFN